MQHAFGKNYTAEINYVGTRGIHLPVQDIINLAIGSHSRERLADLSSGAGPGNARCSAEQSE